MNALGYEDVWDTAPDPRRDRLAAAFVTSMVAMATGVPAREIAAPTRARAPAARARQIAMYLAHVGYAWPMSRVAMAFGRDRTTASHACHRIEDLRDDAAFDAQISAMEACLREAPEPCTSLAA
jgi:chromosomal replication initiation ATPase DnaA